jgi:anti-sigma regulatory factor (Ser/Thr protein kinase)
MQYKDPAWISVSGSVAGEAALTQFLGDEPDGARDTELMIYASGVDRVDVLTGVASRMRIARHLRKHPDGGVTITPPNDGAVAGRLLDLLSELPEGVSVTAEPERPARQRYALIPATQIRDADDAHLAGETALEACEAARVSDDRASIIALAVMDIAENALLHAADPEDPPVVAATVSGRERFVEIAVVDSGRGISEAESPEELLAGLPAPLNGAGILPELLRRGKRADLNVRIEILAGTGRLRWRWNGHATTKGVYVPGTTVVFTVNP